VNLVTANASVPADALQRHLRQYPEDEPLRAVLTAIFAGLEHMEEVGSLLQLEEQLDHAIEQLRSKGSAAQASMLPVLGVPVPPRQETMELNAPSWDDWKRSVLERLHARFQEEAQATDLSTALFGAQAEKGLGLIDLLSRRYDVVAANPPYMGSSNMGLVLKRYVERRYPDGKRDLYAVFIERCLQLAADDGQVAMVTQQSWMFLRSFAELRKQLLAQQAIDCLAHLGPHAFEEITGEVVNVVLFVLTRAVPPPDHRLWAARLIGPTSAREKDALLRAAIQAGQAVGRSERHEPGGSRQK